MFKPYIEYIKFRTIQCIAFGTIYAYKRFDKMNQTYLTILTAIMLANCYIVNISRHIQNKSRDMISLPITGCESN
jgi:hypothetical protein